MPLVCTSSALEVSARDFFKFSEEEQEIVKTYLLCQVANGGGFPPAVPTPTGLVWTITDDGLGTNMSWDAVPAGVTKTEVWTSADNITFALERTIVAPANSTATVNAPAFPGTRYAKIRFCIGASCGSFTAALSVTNDVVNDWVRRINVNGGLNPSAGTQNAARTFYNTLNGAGLWTKFYAMNIVAPDSAIAARTPLIKGAGSDPWVMAGGSLTVDGLLATTNALNTGWNPTGLWTSTDACWLCYVFNNPDSNPTGQSTAGCRDTGAANFAMFQSNYMNQYYGWMFTNDASSLIAQTMPAHPAGLWALSREANNFLQSYRGQATFAPGTMEAINGTPTVNAKGPPNRTFFFCGENVDGVDTPDTQRRQSFCATASKLTAAELQTVFVAVTLMRQAFGGGWV